MLILLLKLRFDILMWLIFFQKAVRSIVNIAAVFTCDRWECRNPNFMLCVDMRFCLKLYCSSIDASSLNTGD